jgi:hypothetical protein
LLLIELIRASGIDRALSTALALWRKPLAVRDSGKILANDSVGHDSSGHGPVGHGSFTSKSVGNKQPAGNCSRLPQAAQLAVAARAVAVGLGHPLGVGAALVCLATSSYLRARRSIGGSGADQLRFIVLVVVGLVWAAGWTPTARYLGDLFLAAQVALAYFTAGVAKAVSATWRSRRAHDRHPLHRGLRDPGLR